MGHSLHSLGQVWTEFTDLLTSLHTYLLRYLLTLGLTAMFLVQGRSTNPFMQVFT